METHAAAPSPSLQPLLVRLERKGAETDARETDRARKYLNITRDTGEFLHLLVRATGARRILEVGTSNGYSTLWLATALPAGGRVVTIESNPAKADEARANFELAGLASCIALHLARADEMLPGLTGPFDLIFLDADRSQYLAMVDDLLRILKSGGLIVCDNAVSHASELSAFCAHFQSRPEFSTALVPVGKGEFLIFKP